MTEQKNESSGLTSNEYYELQVLKNPGAMRVAYSSKTGRIVVSARENGSTIEIDLEEAVWMGKAIADMTAEIERRDKREIDPEISVEFDRPKACELRDRAKLLMQGSRTIGHNGMAELIRSALGSLGIRADETRGELSKEVVSKIYDAAAQNAPVECLDLAVNRAKKSAQLIMLSMADRI